ncbi:hypothetical protein [Pseudomonas vanderleydeniana]|uniref:Uncharacterized protein n=1 Tax=Pseudomonas vanderleydeniana TaxID=2745495 RepID=A0A9E6TU51_9PSED|nr:hypothetical protein [Pseudomonas vanderleydeniana]QXI30494.1 hypothetical protein HU752_011345 [Pseudomonas vanderleydeniana]
MKFKLNNRTLSLLKAQSCLTETFTHTLRSEPQRQVVSFRLAVERNQASTTFGILLGSEHHTLTLPNSPKMHLKLADFIEEIVNGPADTVTPAELPHAEREYGNFEIEHKQQVFELISRGGSASLDLGFALPINISVHRNQTRTGVTTIMSIGNSRPRTKCFTVCGSDIEIYKRLIQSLDHLAAAATPAAHAA